MMSRILHTIAYNSNTGEIKEFSRLIEKDKQELATTNWVNDLNRQARLTYKASGVLYSHHLTEEFIERH